LDMIELRCGYQFDAAPSPLRGDFAMPGKWFLECVGISDPTGRTGLLSRFVLGLETGRRGDPSASGCFTDRRVEAGLKRDLSHSDSTIRDTAFVFGGINWPLVG
jgi:hypothetical protein